MLDVGTLAAAGALALVAGAVYLLIKYPNRAAFTPEMPGVPLVDNSLPLLGHAFELARTAPYMHEWYLELAKKHGDVFRTTMWLPGMAHADMVTTLNVKDVEAILRDPYLFEKGDGMRDMNQDLFGHGIFATDGDLWKVQRKVASNIFNVRNFRDLYAPIFVEDSTNLRRHLSIVADHCKSHPDACVDIQDLLLRSTMDSFVKLSMGGQLGNLAGEGTFDAEGRYRLHEIPFAKAFDLLNSHVTKRFQNPLWKITERLDGTHAQMRSYQKTLDDFTLSIVRRKRAEREKDASKGSKESGGDLLDYFLNVKNEDGTDISDRQLQDTVRNMIVAGRDTTAQTMSWVVYTLSQRPDVADKVRAEMDAVIGPDKDKLPDYSHFNGLKYSMAVFNEVLRLHSNVPFNFKHPTQDTVLPGSGTKVFAGQRVQFVTFAMGRYDKIWGPDAEEFKPERWLDEKGSLRKEDSYKYPVFNAGPRICLGMDLARQEAMVLMAAIFRRFRLTVVREDDPEKYGDPAGKRGRYDLQVTLAVRKSLDVKVEAI
ncbi:cytochrome P450 [Hyaloraphidium curvatum]|nr:cytochrome P450 [Hyaloraphidium curvatum]